MKDDNCIFCKLANKDIPTNIIYEDDRLSGRNFIFQIIEHAMFVCSCIWLCLFHNIISFEFWYTMSIRLGIAKSNTYFLVT